MGIIWGHGGRLDIDIKIYREKRKLFTYRTRSVESFILNGGIGFKKPVLDVYERCGNCIFGSRWRTSTG